MNHIRYFIQSSVMVYITIIERKLMSYFEMICAIRKDASPNSKELIQTKEVLKN